MQLEFDEAAWAKSALALQVQAQLTGHDEIIVVMNDDPEHGAQEPFFLGEAVAPYDAKAGEAGMTSLGSWVIRRLFLVKCATTMSFLTSSSTSRSRSARTYMRGLERGSLSTSTLRTLTFAMFDWRR